MQGRNAVDRVRADERQLPHAHPPPVPLVDQRRGRQRGVVRAASLAHALQVLGVQAVDDLEVPGQQALDQRHRPGLQRFRQQGVVGVGDGGHGDPPRLVPLHPVHVHEQAHELRDGHGGMRVVELDRRLVGERAEVVHPAEVVAQQVLQGGGDEEELLPQPQFLPRGRFVAGVEHARDRFQAHALAERADMVAAVELVEVERRGGAGGPQAQGVGVAADCSSRQPPMTGVSKATADSVSAGSQTVWARPCASSRTVTSPPKPTGYAKAGRANSQGLPSASQSSGNSF